MAETGQASAPRSNASAGTSGAISRASPSGPISNASGASSTQLEVPAQSLGSMRTMNVLGNGDLGVLGFCQGVESGSVVSRTISPVVFFKRGLISMVIAIPGSTRKLWLA